MKFKHVLKAFLPTLHGEMDIYGFELHFPGDGPIALVKGQLGADKTPLLRIHSQCLTGEAFHSLRCDCGDQLNLSMEYIHREGCGLIIYLFQEGRGIGLMNKIRAYRLQDEGMNTVEANRVLGYLADSRSYRMAVEVLHHFGVKRVRLMSNNPLKASQLREGGIEIVSMVPLIVPPNPYSSAYLNAKRDKMGHIFD